MKQKIKILALILVTLSIVFGTQVTADIISRPTVVNPELDLSLDNPAIWKELRGGTSLHPDSTIIGPYYVYYVNKDGELELNAAHFNIFRSDGKIDLMILSEGQYELARQVICDIDEDFYMFFNESHAIVGNEYLSYVVKPSGIEEINGEYTLFQFEPETAPKRQADVKEIMGRYSGYLMNASQPQRIKRDEALSLMSDFTPDIHGYEVDLVDQGTFGTCYSASIASIVRFREPDLYGDLTADEVQEAGAKKYVGIFNNVYSTTLEVMYNVMMDCYLNNGETHHFSNYFDTTNRPMSETSYKSIIDHECIMLGWLRTTDQTGIHVLVMNQYYYDEDGEFVAYCMDPFKLEMVDLKWQGDYLHQKFGYTDIYLNGNITSYY